MWASTGDRPTTQAWGKSEDEILAALVTDQYEMLHAAAGVCLPGRSREELNTHWFQLRKARMYPASHCAVPEWDVPPRTAGYPFNGSQ
jgi:hypothetical protein